MVYRNSKNNFGGSFHLRKIRICEKTQKTTFNNSSLLSLMEDDVLRASSLLLEKNFQKKLEDISPFCGATDTPVLDFKPRVGPLCCLLCDQGCA